MASSTPTTRTPLMHRMDHNQPQQQPHRNPSPRSKTENSHAQAARPRTAGTSYQASRRPHPSSEPKGPQARQQPRALPSPRQGRGRQNSASSQQAATPQQQARGQARPGARYYSSSEMYPLATKRAYSLAINISSGDSTMQLTRASLPPTFTPTPSGVTKVER